MTFLCLRLLDRKKVSVAPLLLLPLRKASEGDRGERAEGIDPVRPFPQPPPRRRRQRRSLLRGCDGKNFSCNNSATTTGHGTGGRGRSLGRRCGCSHLRLARPVRHVRRRVDAARRGCCRPRPRRSRATAASAPALPPAAAHVCGRPHLPPGAAHLAAPGHHPFLLLLLLGAGGGGLPPRLRLPPSAHRRLLLLRQRRAALLHAKDGGRAGHQLRRLWGQE